MQPGKPNTRLNGRAAGVTINTSVYGGAVPLLYGRHKCSPKLIWLGAMTWNNGGIKAKVKAGGGSSYQYWVPCDFLLCHSPLFALLTLWDNQTIYNLIAADNDFTVVAGGPNGWGKVNISSWIPSGWPYTVLGAALNNVNACGAALSARSVAYALGNIVSDGSHQQKCTTAGTIGSGAPSWNGTLGGMTTDGTVTWTNIGPITATFDDFGGDGVVTYNASFRRPLWNWGNYPPDPSGPSDTGYNRYAPYVFAWPGPSGSGDVYFHPQLIGSSVRVFWTQQEDAVAPPNCLSLETEWYLGNDNAGGTATGQPIIYPWCSGAGSPKLYLGQTPTLPMLAFEAQGNGALNQNGDCDPMFIIADLIASGATYATKTQTPITAGDLIPIIHGLNCTDHRIPSTIPGMNPATLGKLLGDTQAASEYCAAYGIYCSLYLESQRSARDVLKDLFDIANTAPVYSGAQLKCIPYCEQSMVGNGAVYTAPTASGPVCSLDDSVFLTSASSAVNAPVTISRTRQADSVSAITIEHYDRSNAYEKTTTTEVDESSLVQFGPRPDSSGSRGGSSSRSLDELCDTAIAQNVASVLVKRAANLRNTYKFTLPATYCFLEAMDLVAITDSYLGLTALPVRLTSVTENDDLTLDCEAEQFIYGLSAPTPLEVQQATPPINPATQFSGNVNPPIFFEPPDSLTSSDGPSGSAGAPAGPGYELWLALSGPGAAAWESSEGYVYGDLVLDSNGNIQKCITAGTSGGSAPAWNTTPGGTTTDNTVTWLNCGPQALAGPANNWGGCSVWLSSDGVTYTEQGAATSPAVMGALNGSITSSATSVAIDVTESGTEPAVPASGQPQLALVENEVIGYTGVTMTGANQFTLTGVTRGLNGTVAAAHSGGAGFCVLNAQVFKLQLASSWVGQTVYLKFLSFNSQGGQAQTLDEVDAFTYSFTGKYNNFLQVVGCNADGIGVALSGGTVCGINIYGNGGSAGSTSSPGTAVNLYKSDGSTISVGGFKTLLVDFTNTALSFSAWYYVLYNPDDGSLHACYYDTDMIKAVYNGMVLLAQVQTTASDGSGGSGQSGGNGGFGGGSGKGSGQGGCPTLDMWLDSDRSLHDVQDGWEFDCLSFTAEDATDAEETNSKKSPCHPERSEGSMHSSASSAPSAVKTVALRKHRISTNPCVRIVAEDGAWLDCSIATPFTVPCHPDAERSEAEAEGPAPCHPEERSDEGPAPCHPEERSDEGPAPCHPEERSAEGPAPCHPEERSDEGPAFKTVWAEKMLGELVATDAGPGTPVTWSRVASVKPMGAHKVVYLDLGGSTFACGWRKGRRMYSHNAFKAP